MKKIRLILVLVIILLTTASPQTKHVVMVSNYTFTPKDISITVGDTVEWKWVEGMHTTTSDDITGSDVWDQPITGSNSVFSIVINTPGLHGYHCTPHLALGMVGSITATSPAGISEQSNFVNQFKLEQNYPNPFNPSTVIKYTLPSEGYVTLKVYNTLGNEVATLVNGPGSRGDHFVVFDITGIKNLAIGIYFYRLKAGPFEKTHKMMLIK